MISTAIAGISETHAIAAGSLNLSTMQPFFFDRISHRSRCIGALNLG